MTRSALFLLLSFASFACSEGEKTTTPPDIEAIDLAKEEVMSVHDPAMERMNLIDSLSEALKDKLQAVQDSALQIDLVGRIDSLEIARQGMMNWMHQYNPTYPDELPLEEGLAYLVEQKDSIARVAVLMELEIEKAKTALK